MRAKAKVYPKGEKWVAVMFTTGVVMHIEEKEAIELRDQLTEALGQMGTIKPGDLKSSPNASQYLHDLEYKRGALKQGRGVDDVRRLDASRLNTKGERGKAAHANLIDAIEAHGWEDVQAALVWGWLQVLERNREPVLQANTFSRGGAGFEALFEKWAQAVENERAERLAAQAAEQEREAKEAELKAAEDATDVIADQAAKVASLFKAKVVNS